MDRYIRLDAQPSSCTVTVGMGKRPGSKGDQRGAFDLAEAHRMWTIEERVHRRLCELAVLRALSRATRCARAAAGGMTRYLPGTPPPESEAGGHMALSDHDNLPGRRLSLGPERREVDPGSHAPALGITQVPLCLVPPGRIRRVRDHPDLPARRIEHHELDRRRSRQIEVQDGYSVVGLVTDPELDLGRRQLR